MPTEKKNQSVFITSETFKTLKQGASRKLEGLQFLQVTNIILT